MSFGTNPEYRSISFLETPNGPEMVRHGGCGFVGTSQITGRLDECGLAIRVVDNPSAETRENLRSAIQLIEISPGKLASPSLILSPG